MTDVEIVAWRASHAVTLRQNVPKSSDQPRHLADTHPAQSTRKLGIFTSALLGRITSALTSGTANAIDYTLKREAALRRYLDDGRYPIDNNWAENQVRPIALGRKNWLFCWTELGAKYLGILQSLLSTCRLHHIHPYDYLVDVLQRIDTHPAKDVRLLTPRLWKEHFASAPMRAPLDILGR